ncbi:MAG: hypothetical protein ACO1PI_14975 [Bacteroidota bacterium]
MKYTTSTIKAEMRKTIFAAHEHLAITINDETLDVYIDEFYPEEEYLGLIPTLLPVYADEKEYQMVLDRILPKEGKTTLAPVLMCPEDLDLSCTTIVAQAKTQGDYVIWEKLGLDISGGENFPEGIGTKVQWLGQIKPIYFKKSEYVECLAEFKKLEANQ